MYCLINISVLVKLEKFQKYVKSIKNSTFFLLTNDYCNFKNILQSKFNKPFKKYVYLSFLFAFKNDFLKSIFYAKLIDTQFFLNEIFYPFIFNEILLSKLDFLYKEFASKKNLILFNFV